MLALIRSWARGAQSSVAIGAIRIDPLLTASPGARGRADRPKTAAKGGSSQGTNGKVRPGECFEWYKASRTCDCREHEAHQIVEDRTSDHFAQWAVIPLV